VAAQDSLQWVSASGGSVPSNAVPGGITCAQEKLYIGRVHHEGALVSGKIHPSLGVLYFTYGGKELKSSTYEVLVEPVVEKKVTVVQPIIEEKIVYVEREPREDFHVVENVQENVRVIRVERDHGEQHATTRVIEVVRE